jgi:cytochrome c oxidase cbb3-type subunit 1
MDPFVRKFIRGSLAWLGVGVTLGLAMALEPRWAPARPAHMHAGLLGFVSMMIFGVAYHVLPRFSGRPLHSRPMATAHLWIANAGLAGMVAGFLVRLHAATPGALLLGTGGALSATGAYLFIYNLWRTLPVSVPACANTPALPTLHPDAAPPRACA